MLALGTELGPTDYDMYEDGGFAVAGKLIRIDIDPAQSNRPFPPHLSLVGDAALAVEDLLRQLNGTAPQKSTGALRAECAREDIQELTNEMRMDLTVLNALRDHFPDSDIVGDSTQYVYAGNMAFEMASEARYFNSACGFGTLSYGLPAAIGASIASGKRTICLSGDGGLQFCLGELATAREIDADVLLLLHDNNGYGEIKFYVTDRAIPEIGVDIYTPNLVQMAKAAGWTVLCTKVGEMDIALQEAKNIEGPIMLYLTEDARRQPFPNK
ncbi:MAG: thiamine pyrophosphate-dependent enzyme [Paracoccaceae bacterium]